MFQQRTGLEQKKRTQKIQAATIEEQPVRTQADQQTTCTSRIAIEEQLAATDCS